MAASENWDMYNDGSNAAKIGILTVSDRAASGEYEDLSGPAVSSFLAAHIVSPWTAITRVIPDNRELIEASLIELVDWKHCCLVITTGGTGPALRDLTPEATESVCDRLLPGFGEAMRQESLRTVPTAILSRQIAGTRAQSLIINLPGKPVSINVCLGAIWPAVGPCIRLLGAQLDTRNT